MDTIAAETLYDSDKEATVAKLFEYHLENIQLKEKLARCNSKEEVRVLPCHRDVTPPPLDPPTRGLLCARGGSPIPMRWGLWGSRAPHSPPSFLS